MRAAPTLLAAAASLVAACGTSAPTVEPADSRPAGAWERTAAVEDANRQALTALAVGEEVVVVAGSTGAAERLTALAYDPAADRWRQVRPSPLRWRVGYAAVSTGEELLVWGGVGNGGGAATGAAYDPASDAWRRLAQAPLSGRAFHSAVWTGAELLVWGGAAPGLDGERADGAAYDPAAGRWRPLPEAPLAGRYRHAAAWTGEAMVIVGGSDDAESEGTRGAPQRFLADAAAYDPTADVWRLLPPAPFDPVGPPSAVWTGREVIVWDGSSGAAYNPASDAWRPLAEAPLTPREGFTAVWDGRRLLVWGGVEAGCGDCPLGDGAAYDPDADAWTPLPAAPLSARDRHAAAWTGTVMLVWGGCCAGDRYHGDGAVFEP